MPTFDRSHFRPYALDDALLYFQPLTGLSVRVDAPSTRGLRREAPRVVLFSLSHACNLRCTFCSRDTNVQDRWNWEDAFQLLRALNQKGTLEVAFGGGEPLAHQGVLPLLTALREQTSLAVHLTTNGTLITSQLAETLSQVVDEIRVSVYEGEAWELAVSTLVQHGVQTAVNLLVGPHNLDALPALLDQALDLGCSNVALLRYVGKEPARALSGVEWQQLEWAIRRAPLPVRLSHCFADRLPNVPRLFGAELDCGAGQDFLVIDPDRHFRACSFHQERVPFDDADDLLSLFQKRQVELDAPAEFSGCARPLASRAALSDGVRIYRGYSSNNSGDTVLVATFESAEEAQQVVELANREPGKEDFEVELRAVGRTLMATGYDADDALPGLRELVHQRASGVIYTAVHLHDSPSLLVGLGAGADVPGLELALWTGENNVVVRSGSDLFALLSHDGSPGWTQCLDEVQSRAHAENLALTAELVVPDDAERLVDGVRVKATSSTEGYFAIWFYDEAVAREFAAQLERTGVTQVGTLVLVSTRRARPRILKRASKHSAFGYWLPQDKLRIAGTFAPVHYKKKILIEDVQSAFRRVGVAKFDVKTSYGCVVAKTETTAPHQCLANLRLVLDALRQEGGEVRFYGSLRTASPLAHAVNRSRRELKVLGRGAT